MIRAGVPSLTCDCAVCTSDDPRDKRLRCSALVQYDDGTTLLIDSSIDARQQLLGVGLTRLDAILQVYLPGAMTSIITGLRMSMGFGWRALIAAEMIGGDSGLGFMIFVSAQ